MATVNIGTVLAAVGLAVTITGSVFVWSLGIHSDVHLLNDHAVRSEEQLKYLDKQFQDIKQKQTELQYKVDNRLVLIETNQNVYVNGLKEVKQEVAEVKKEKHKGD